VISTAENWQNTDTAMADQNAIQENEREPTNSTRKLGGWARLCIVLTALWWALVGAFVYFIPRVLRDEDFLAIVVIAFAPPIVLLMFGWVVRGFVKHGL
jgi:hypothetical protein